MRASAPLRPLPPFALRTPPPSGGRAASLFPELQLSAASAIVAKDDERAGARAGVTPDGAGSGARADAQ